MFKRFLEWAKPAVAKLWNWAKPVVKDALVAGAKAAALFVLNAASKQLAAA